MGAKDGGHRETQGQPFILKRTRQQTPRKVMWPPQAKDPLEILAELPKFLSLASDSESASVGKSGPFGYSNHHNHPVGLVLVLLPLVRNKYMAREVQ